MKKRVSVKKILLLLLLFLLLAVTGMLVWIFFLPKKYTVMYHMSGNRTIESAEVILQILLSGFPTYGTLPYVGKPDNRICRSYSVWKPGKRRVWIFDVSAGR